MISVDGRWLFYKHSQPAKTVTFILVLRLEAKKNCCFRVATICRKLVTCTAHSIGSVMSDVTAGKYGLCQVTSTV